MGQARAPLFEAIQAHLRDDDVRLHVPGHKGGRGAAEFLAEALGQEAARLDLTELPGLDDLHSPTGPIADAEALAAEAFGAAKTFFLVNGSTAGVLAMMLATVRPGEIAYVPRAMHRSLLSALVLTGADPVYLEPRVDEAAGLPLPQRPGDLVAAVRRHPGGPAAFLVDPTYHGLCADLDCLGEEAAAVGVRLCVDEAHGAHFGFAPELPPRALASGKVVAATQSLHKMGAALTQGALLHLASDGLDPERTRAALAAVQTSSPSYLFMASLDLARRFMATAGPTVFAGLARSMRATAARLSAVTGLRVFEGPASPRGSDPLKLTLLLDAPGDARDLARDLAERHGVHAELADERAILFIAGPGTTTGDLERLRLGVEDYLRRAPAGRPAVGAQDDRAGRDLAGLLRHLPPRATTPREAFFARSERVSIADALGRVAAEAVVPAPPGIPVVMPGERLDHETIERLNRLARAGAHGQGGGPGLDWIRVLA
ncbi:MAG: aminotransferase class I/II-fold pyridoxal phosphate-dependent enzyme [Bacillota bacterium]